ncbi:glycosyltransferase family 2 protein [Nocardioides mangrovi]|uniref:Glycosyltransferase n=1 Tax=Nocardioides mangrovi TaxID=2874580 RepID=A0ABS7U7E0_9ACTN|nr:glycosyltransferase family 2 protein [Nocardioides mangrovi]MBZ5736899.1 glycosyltransferase [Nocardioides mangrovi]
MTARPAVTAVIPTFRRPRLALRAVRSVVAQQYAGQVEVVVVADDGDPPALPLDVPPTRSLRVITNHRRPGLAGARNSGIEVASHDHVAFLDDDDYWLPGKLTAQMDLLDRSPDAALVGSAILADDGRRSHERLVPVDPVTHADLLRDRLAGLHSSSLLFRKEALTGAIGMVDEDIPGSYCEDWDLLLRASAVAPIPVVNRPLVRATWTGESYFLGRWEAYAAGLEYLVAKHPDLRRDARGHGAIAGKIAFSRAAAGDRRAAIRWASESLRRDPSQRRSWLAIAVALRLVSADRVVAIAQSRGKGI